MRRVDVIVNHRSGASDKDEVAGHVDRALRAHGFDVRLVLARTAGELQAAAAAAAAGDAEMVVAGGGDGTIAAVASHLLDTPKAFGVLPLGTFNYFARRLQMPLDVDGAIEALARGTVTPIGVGDVNGHLFLNNASIGLYPAVLRQRETTYRRLGRSRVVAYLSVAMVLVQPPALLNLLLTADGRRVSRRTPLLFVGANAYQMESFALPGRDCLDAGKLAAYITRPLGVTRLWRLAARAFARGLYGSDALELLCARELDVTVRRRRIGVAMDGEVMPLTPPLRFRWRADALRVVVPAELPATPSDTPPAAP